MVLKRLNLPKNIYLLYPTYDCRNIQAGIELGLNQAETDSLELINKSQIIHFFHFQNSIWVEYWVEYWLQYWD